MTYDIAELRQREFPWAAAGEAVYLNNASTGPLPRRALEAVSRFNGMRAKPHTFSDEMMIETFRRSRELVARLVGASHEEVALAINTTFGINLAANSLPLGPGDTVLGVEQEFPANVYPWMHAARRRGFDFRLMPCGGGVPDQDALIAALDGGGDRIKAVALSWVAFASGYRFDLRRVGEACRERGIYFVVDAIQGLGALTLDLAGTHVDVLACGAQKWLLSPWGTGFVYVRRDLIPRLEPHDTGWMAVKGSDDFSRLTDYDLTWRDDARRYELLTLPCQDFAGMNAALELLHDIGPAAAERHVRALADLVVERTQSVPGLTLVTPQDPAHRAGILALRTHDPVRAGRRLREAGVVHSLREGSIRLSPHFFNTVEEVDAAMDTLAG